jgi:hypothetical protein
MIIVECYKDQALVYRIGFTPDRVRHAHNKSRVLWTVEKRQKAVGIIDEDPSAGHPGYLKEYGEKDAIGRIKLLIRRDDDGKRLVQISPRLEDWLYGIAKRNKILPNRFGLPDDPEELHSMSLGVGKNRENFQKFVDELRGTKNDEISMLKRWITEAIE